MNENWSKIKHRYGTITSADGSSASTVLRDLESYIIVVVVLAPGEPSDTNVFDLGSLTTNHVIQFVNGPSVASLLDVSKRRSCLNSSQAMVRSCISKTVAMRLQMWIFSTFVIFLAS